MLRRGATDALVKARRETQLQAVEEFGALPAKLRSKSPSWAGVFAL